MGKKVSGVSECASERKEGGHGGHGGRDGGGNGREFSRGNHHGDSIRDRDNNAADRVVNDSSPGEDNKDYNNDNDSEPQAKAGYLPATNQW